MNFLILGDGAEEFAWARAIAASAGHHLLAAYPALDGLPEARACRDIDDALAMPGVEAVVVGGEPDFRAEALRRVAGAGLPAVCLHPPGPDSEAYYQVALSRAETGAVLVPDLPARLHPGVEAVRRSMEIAEPGAFKSLRYEAVAEVSESDLARFAFARAVDLVRSLVGEIDAVNATGDPPGDRPDESLVVQLRASGSRRAEVRLTSGREEPARLTLTLAGGTQTLELPADLGGPSRLVRLGPDGIEHVTTFDAWDPHAAILGVLADAVSGRAAHPDLADGTRAMEVAEGVVRSLRKGRTVDLHYEDISEAGTFKSVMTSVGCLVLLSILVVVPVALAGPALGVGWTIYFAYAIPPLLVVFALLQLLRFAARDAGAGKREI
jgi:predicted dehydrogenase